MLFKEIILPALKISWRKKWLWPIALLVITPLTISNEWTLADNFISAVANPLKYFTVINNLDMNQVINADITLSNLFSAIIYQPIIAFSFLLVIILVSIFALFLAWIIVNAQGVIIYNAQSSQKEISFSLNRSLNAVTPHWLPLLELNLSLLIIKTLLISYLLLLGLFMSSSWSVILWWFVIAASIIFTMSISYIIRLGMFKVILERRRIKPAIKESYLLFKNNYLGCFEFSFILFLLTAIALAIIVILVGFIVPDTQLVASVINILLLKTGWGAFIAEIFILLFIGLLGAMLILWQYTAWVLWFENIQKGGKFSYLLKWFKGIKKKRLNA